MKKIISVTETHLAYIPVNKKVMKARPIEDRIIILPVAADEAPTGFYEHSKAIEKPLQGIVQAIGEGKYILVGEKMVLTPMNVKVGEYVSYGKHIGTPIVIDGVEYIIMRLGDAYAIL